MKNRRLPPPPMCAELFKPESVMMPSPRLAWLDKHGVRTHFARHCPGDPWCAWFGTVDPVSFNEEHGGEAFGYGKSEDQAISALAKKQGWKLWNEEGEFVV
jgi:hypothetical protein